MNLTISRTDILWPYKNKIITVLINHVDQAIFSHDQNVVIVLAGKDVRSKKIIAYELNGHIRCEIKQPEAHTFNGLAPNREKDAAVLSTIYNLGWRDWWFAINTTEKTVESLGEAR